MANKAKPLIIFGASGHAKVVIDVVEREKSYDIDWLVDDDPKLLGLEICGYQIAGDRSALLTRAKDVEKHSILIAIGQNQTRTDIAHWVKQHGYELATAMDPSAEISRRASIGHGSVIMPGCVINADTTIGENCIINTSASVDHDCKIGNGVHIAPGAALCGGVTVGDTTLVGAGAIIIPGVTVGKNAMIAAGSTVTKDLGDGVKVAGPSTRQL